MVYFSRLKYPLSQVSAAAAAAADDDDDGEDGSDNCTVDSYCACHCMLDICGAPPYPPDSYDRILLDAPCSGLGQRPAVNIKQSLAEVTSYPPLQRRLFETVLPSVFHSAS